MIEPLRFLAKLSLFFSGFAAGAAVYQAIYGKWSAVGLSLALVAIMLVNHWTMERSAAARAMKASREGR